MTGLWFCCPCQDEQCKTRDLVPDGKDDIDLLQNYIYKAEENFTTIRLDLKYRRDWKYKQEVIVRWTNDQIKWKRKWNIDFVRD